LKKILVLAITTIMVFGFASFAMADVELGGDARVRGIWQRNHDAVDTVPDGMRTWDQRVRLNLTATVDDVKVVTRMTVSEGTWGDQVKGADPVGNVYLDTDDYAYIVTPVGPVTISAGRQLANWGNKYLSWGSPKNRFKIIYKTDGGITTGFFIDKNTDRDRGDLDGDNDSYVIPVIGTFGDLKAGLLLVHNVNNGFAGGKSTTGNMVDVFVSGDAGGMSVKGEFAMMMGDNYDVAGSARMGMMAEVAMDMDGMKVTGTLAFADNGYSANKYSNQSLLFGSSQATAYSDFSAPANESATLIAVGVDMAMGDNMDVGAKFAMVDGFLVGASMMEIDGTLKYKLNDKAAWMFDLAIGMPDKVSASDDMIMSLAQRLEVKF
jgi:hypothetical protein